ncbi:glycosyltransferase family 2 protein [Microbulbifer sp. EKSA005]|uniref:glycosyltransferase family 2 protein n=1 Tax=Microbulbifer sp. EKSA005 TaxID=3243364 RepID=UPI004042642E
MVSVIVTTYNIEKYIDHCLQSVLDQTLTDIEVIVVDDGSTDSTPELIRNYAQKDERIIPVLLPENTPGGVAVAANVGLRKATKEYVGFVDGDDWCEPFMFERLVDAAKSNNAEVVIGKFKNFDEETASFYEASDERYWLSGLPLNTVVSGDDERKKILKLNPVPWRKLYLRSFLQENDIFFPEGDYFYEDNPFHWYCVTAAKSFALIDDYLCYHRMNRVGQTMSAGDERLLAMYQHHDTIFKWLNESGKYSEFKEELILWIVNNSCWIYDSIKDELKQKVLEDLSVALLLHDKSVMTKIIMSENMGLKGRGLVRDAMSLAGQEKLARRIKDRKGVFSRAVVFLKEEGFLSTFKHGVKYCYHRSPFFVQRAITKSRNFVSSENASNNQLMKKLQDIESKVILQGYMLALSDNFENEVKKELAEIRLALAEIKKNSAPDRDS